MTKTPDFAPDYAKYRQYSYLTLEEGMQLLLGIKPEYNIAGLGVRYYVPFEDKNELLNRLEIARRAIEAGDLKPDIIARGAPSWAQKFRPYNFLKFAQKNGWEIPVELIPLLASAVENEQPTRLSGEHRPGDLDVIVDDINETVTAVSKNGATWEFKREDIVGARGTATWDLLVGFAKFKGSLEGTVLDRKKPNTSANRQNLDAKLVAAMGLDQSPIIDGRRGVMCFRSICLAGSYPRHDALDRRTVSLDDQSTNYLRRHGQDMPPLD